MGFTLLFIIFIGLASGLAVGSGLVAFLTILGVIPRLVHLTKTRNVLRYYEWAVIIGAIAFSMVSLNNVSFQLAHLFVILIGAFSGVFIGMLAAALFEVLNVIPILSKRIGFPNQVIIFLMAIAFGKVFGSLFQWIIFYPLRFG